MKPSRTIVALLLTTAACASQTEAPPAAPTTPPPVAVAPSPPPPAAPAPAPAPTPEEEKKAKEKKQLEADFQKLASDHATETARLTPEVRAEAKALAEKSYPSIRAATTAALKSKHRRPGNAERDAARHPVETLEFFGLRPTHTVLEYGPGEGWYTELLAPALAKKGKLMVAIGDPNGPRTERGTFYAERTKLFLDRLPEAYGKVEPVIIDPKAPKLPLENKVDFVLLSRSAHGMYNNKTLNLWLAEFHRALKPRGTLAVEQHRAAAGANPDETSKHGYLPEAWLIEQIEAAGFKLAGKSEINANPKDTKDHPEGVWTLPPTLRLGDKDRDKYVAIGESDRMTLKFVKVEKKTPPAGPAAGPTSPAAPTGAAAKPPAAAGAGAQPAPGTAPAGPTAPAPAAQPATGAGTNPPATTPAR